MGFNSGFKGLICGCKLNVIFCKYHQSTPRDIPEDRRYRKPFASKRSNTSHPHCKYTPSSRCSICTTVQFSFHEVISSDHLSVLDAKTNQWEKYNLERCHFKLSASYYGSYHSYLATALWNSNGPWMWQHRGFKQREISEATIKSVAALVSARRSNNLCLCKQTDKWIVRRGDEIFKVGNTANKENSGVTI